MHARTAAIRRLLFVLALALYAAACGYQARGRVVSLTGTYDPDATRIYNYMNTAAGMQETRVDHLIDEAVITSLHPGEACFALTIRSNLLADLHPSQWRVALNGAPAFVEESAARATETWRTTFVREEVVSRERSPQGEVTYSQPVEREGVGGYTVRHARACAPLAPRVSVLRLVVELAHPFGEQDWGQVYEWHLRG